MNSSLLYPRTTASRRAVSLNGMWKFQFDPKAEGLEKGYANGLPAACLMPVPSSFCDIFTDKESREYTGDFWYETDVFVPGEWEGNEVVIRFASATHTARVFVNGEEITSHVGGFLPFNAVVTDKVTYNAYNKLVVLMNNELSETMIPCGTTQTLVDGRKISAPYFDFYNYAGLQRPVTLMMLPKETVTDYEVVHEIAGSAANVNYTVKTTGEKDVAVELYDAAGKKVAQSAGKTGTLHVENVKLWNVHAPYLYKIVIRIVDGGKIVDEYYDTLGIRTFKVEGDKLLLNGKHVYLRGLGKHEDSDLRGRALDLVTVKRDYECLKWIGANCFRTSHYPYAEELYYRADEEGFLLIDETPAVGMMESLMNFTAANQGNGKAQGFFEKETTPQLLEHHLETIREMITRDKNHASVIAWSLLNEPQCTSEGTEAYFKSLFDYAHELDPQKRPRTYAIIMMSLPHTSRGQQFADILSLNRYYGWYVMGGASLPNAEAAFHQEMQGWDKVRNGRPMIFTEYGADTLSSEHKLPSVMWSQEYQNEYLDMNHRVFDTYPWVQGELMWNFADFQTTEGIMRVNGNKKGAFTRQRQPKDVAFLLKKRWESLPVDYKG